MMRPALFPSVCSTALVLDDRKKISLTAFLFFSEGAHEITEHVGGGPVSRMTGLHEGVADLLLHSNAHPGIFGGHARSSSSWIHICVSISICTSCFVARPQVVQTIGR